MDIILLLKLFKIVHYKWLINFNLCISSKNWINVTPHQFNPSKLGKIAKCPNFSVSQKSLLQTFGVTLIINIIIIHTSSIINVIQLLASKFPQKKTKTMLYVWSMPQIGLSGVQAKCISVLTDYVMPPDKNLPQNNGLI